MLLGTPLPVSPKLTRWRVLPVSAFPQSIALRCRVTPPFTELRQMLPVGATPENILRPQHVQIALLQKTCGQFAERPSKTRSSFIAERSFRSRFRRSWPRPRFRRPPRQNGRAEARKPDALPASDSVDAPAVAPAGCPAGLPNSGPGHANTRYAGSEWAAA